VLFPQANESQHRHYQEAQTQIKKCIHHNYNRSHIIPKREEETEFCAVDGFKQGIFTIMYGSKIIL
jgi:hypothetical protein